MHQCQHLVFQRLCIDLRRKFQELRVSQGPFPSSIDDGLLRGIRVWPLFLEMMSIIESLGNTGGLYIGEVENMVS